ncbi:hypothetical protein CD351_03855 [Erythrobacter sp. KY5]|uniref:FliH/SctL family protein n=1 Tax=Erythrobacter sp. KY5 TaxID=2011159 RepID=UPI000DBF1106|nr:FliH/SctL family protein [Erythrobacter sp. KY5]AWW73561.1 hypothetical protein CD351_03855 [Erythrobacter sp. KY5]
MANSSDWIDALECDDTRPQVGAQDWISALTDCSDFIEGLPFASVSPPATPTVPPREEEALQATATPDPIAEAFDAGRAEGLAEAERRYSEREDARRELRLSFRSFDSAATDAFAAHLAQAVMTLCEAAISDFRADPERLLERCKTAAAHFGEAATEGRLHLNPEDMDLLGNEALCDWTVIADESVERSGLRFEAHDGSISDTPADWRRSIAAALKG